MPTTYADRLLRLWSLAKTTSYAFLAFLFLFILAGAAFAQDGGVGALPALADDPLKALASTAEGVSKGNWWAASAGVVSILTWVFRSGVLKKLPKTGALSFLGRAGTWLAENPVASFVTPFALSAALAALTTFASGTPFTVQTLLQEVLKIGAGAVAVFIGVEKVKEAKNAGKLEAAGITTQQDALDELRKRVLKGEVAPAPAPPAA
jgi:hypothetical protein